MVTTDQVQTLVGSGGNVIANDGSKIGGIGQVYLDDQTGQPEWVTAKTGLFGTAESFIPLAGSTVDGNDLRVQWDKHKVKDAPRVDDSDGHLSQQQEEELYRYYGLDYSESRSETGLAGREDSGYETTAGTETTTGYDTSGPTTDDAMTRSEEQLRVGKTAQEAGRARLRKYVVTENVAHTVPVTKERAVVETEPITDTNIDRATAGPDISEEEHEVVLHEEQPVVEKDVTPVERVRLGKEQVTEEHTVSDEVRKERIEAEGVDTEPGFGTDRR